MVVPDTKDGHQIIQFLQSRGSNQCKSCTAVDGSVLLSDEVMERFVPPSIAVSINALLDQQYVLAPRPRIVYSAERDGWTAAAFHRFCDWQAALLFVMRTTEGALIGLFTSRPFESTSFQKQQHGSERKSDPKAFLFELGVEPPVKWPSGWAHVDMNPNCMLSLRRPGSNATLGTAFHVNTNKTLSISTPDGNGFTPCAGDGLLKQSGTVNVVSFVALAVDRQ